jgi:hypothetical protein
MGGFRKENIGSFISSIDIDIDKTAKPLTHSVNQKERWVFSSFPSTA